MPSRDDHLAKADANAELASELEARRRHTEWAITAVFYRALHLVEAHFADSGVHHTSHFSRNRSLLMELPAVWNDYGDLDRLSRLARYEPPGLLGWEHFDGAQASLARIEAELRPRL